MARLTHEFLVGLLAVVVIVLVAVAIMRTDDRPDGVDGTWLVGATFPSAEGVYPDTPVRIAGVTVGSVDGVTLNGSAARLSIMMRGGVELPVDTLAEIKGEGMLGDKFIRLTPGTSAVLLVEGGELTVKPQGADIDGLTEKMSLIAEDVGAITASVRAMTSDQTSQDQLRSTLANIEALSAQLRALAAANQDDLTAVAQNLRSTSETLKAFVEASGGKVDAEMATVKAVTESLERAIGNIEEITRKINDGEGTVGKLLNDGSTMDSINATVEDVGATVKEVRELVGGVTAIRTDVFYRGNYYFGTDPADPAFAGNPVAGGTRNVLGVTIKPRPDYWYLLELTSHPQGLITYEDHLYEYDSEGLPDLGSAYREYVTRPTYRVSFQFAKRWGPAVFRFGMKESSGGAGVDALLFHDRLMLTADIYDFTYGSWPVLDGTPNLQVAARAYPLRHVYLEGGVDNVLLGARYGYFTGFLGGGFTFNDQDLKLILPVLPLSP